MFWENSIRELHVAVTSFIKEKSTGHVKYMYLPEAYLLFYILCNMSYLMLQYTVNWKFCPQHKINASTVYNKKFTNLFIFKIVHRIIRIHNKITLLPVLHQGSSFGEVSHLQRTLKAIPLDNKKINHSLK